MRAKRLTNEERVANKILTLVNDLTLDLDAVGMYMSQNASAVLYNRFITVAESAVENIENRNDRNFL